MLGGDPPFINEQFFAEIVSPEQLDELLASGWRHFGTNFFRYSYAFYEYDVRCVLPLRIRLADFSLSRSQRRTLQKNADLKTVIRPIKITAEAEELFDLHKQRFKTGTPDSIYDFLSPMPDSVPCDGRELAVYDGDRLLAISYFDLGEMSISGIYSMFAPDVAYRRLGIFTMLKEIEFALNSGKKFYYQGYAYEVSSFYDYKKQFRGSEWFDWLGNWRRLMAEPPAIASG